MPTVLWYQTLLEFAPPPSAFYWRIKVLNAWTISFQLQKYNEEIVWSMIISLFHWRSMRKQDISTRRGLKLEKKVKFRETILFAPKVENRQFWNVFEYGASATHSHNFLISLFSILRELCVYIYIVVLVFSKVKKLSHISWGTNWRTPYITFSSPSNIFAVIEGLLS